MEIHLEVWNITAVAFELGFKRVATCAYCLVLIMSCDVTHYVLVFDVVF